MKSAGKIWGKTQQIEANGSLEFHRIEFKADYQCSEHYHTTKSNGFFVESGCLMIKTWPENTSIVDTTILNAGEYMAVPAGVWHQFVGVRDGVAFELYWSEFDKDDISLGHVEFVAATAYLRSTVYSLKTVSELEVRRVAGI